MAAFSLVLVKTGDELNALGTESNGGAFIIFTESLPVACGLWPVAVVAVPA